MEGASFFVREKKTKFAIPHNRCLICTVSLRNTHKKIEWKRLAVILEMKNWRHGVYYTIPPQEEATTCQRWIDETIKQIIIIGLNPLTPTQHQTQISLAT